MNWKTTVAGALAGGAMGTHAVTATPQVNWPELITAILVAVLGYLAQDKGKK